MLARVPYHGGASWAVLQYVLGLRRLGHDVLLVEPVDALLPAPLAYYRAVVERFGLEECSALVVTKTRQGIGRSFDDVGAWARDADVLLNLSGVLREPELRDAPAIRVFVDLDPAFTQLWAAEGVDVGLEGHTHFVTVGSAVPDCGREWTSTFPPVVLDEWTTGNGVRHDGFTTVANWRSYGSVEVGTVLYGQKAHSVRGLMETPRRLEEPVEVALAIHREERGDLEALETNGWRLLDPIAAAGTPDRFHDFVRGSRAELGLAKSGYVLSGCGWFSERSACYLACGRPVLAQETGFSGRIATGEGLLAFETVDELVAGAEEIRRNHEHHRRAARALAEDCFDSDKVLTSLLGRL